MLKWKEEVDRIEKKYEGEIVLDEIELVDEVRELIGIIRQLEEENKSLISETNIAVRMESNMSELYNKAMEEIEYLKDELNKVTK